MLLCPFSPNLHCQVCILFMTEKWHWHLFGMLLIICTNHAMFWVFCVWEKYYCKVRLTWALNVCTSGPHNSSQILFQADQNVAGACSCTSYVLNYRKVLTCEPLALIPGSEPFCKWLRVTQINLLTSTLSSRFLEKKLLFFGSHHEPTFWILNTQTLDAGMSTGTVLVGLNAPWVAFFLN